jgi:hypothetical protein
MAALAITASQVVPDTDAVIDTKIAAATITQGQALCLNSAGRAILFDPGATGTATLYGIAVSAASSGQPVEIQTDGDCDLGAAAGLAAGLAVYCMDTAGAMSVAAAAGVQTSDLTAGGVMSLVGIGIGSNKIRLGIINSGVAKA